MDFISLFLEQFFIVLSQVLNTFVFFYPFFMSYVWIIGALYYYFKWEREEIKLTQPPKLDSYPMVSIIVPCYNEADHIEEIIKQLHYINYPKYEIIAINDGSRDDTAKILKRLMRKSDKLRVVDFIKNQGKATGLNMAAMVSNGEYLVCIDGDSMIEPDSVTWMIRHFLNNPRVGAVTGKPKIRNRSSILGKLQVGEFSAIIGMIKRAQSIYGKIFAVSGVVTTFRKAALHDVGYWSTNMSTEDIDVCWRLQIRHWSVKFEPHAMCWILMPETFKGLWKQRLRWAQGGAEVLLRYPHIFDYKKQRSMWLIYLEYFASISWAFALVGSILLWIAGYTGSFPLGLNNTSIYGMMLGMTFVLQFLVSFYISSNYEKGLFRFYYWLIWYPIAYWMIIAAVSITGFIKALKRDREELAVWESPDRGIR
jgi:biofilm PGA synthesis N-glycosyltransferase PgaC